VSVCATNASKVDAALLDDGVADTLASGSTSAGYNRAAIPLEAGQRSGRPDRDDYGRQRELPRAPVVASLTRRGLCAAARSLAMDYANHGTRVNAVVPGNHQDADASRRPTSSALCIRLAAWLRYPTSQTRPSLYWASFVTGETLPVECGQSGAAETSPCS
jgi:NAD(P)-dependent dehydrogenase (short-subunit alcohol dehydrogenase family)